MRTATTRPGEPLTDSWEHAAICAGIDPELFYPSSYTGADGRYQTQLALMLCSACPVRAFCLNAVLEREGRLTADNRYGIWGGMTPLDRADLMGVERNHRSYRRAA